MTAATAPKTREPLVRRLAHALLVRAVRGGQARGSDWGEAMLAEFAEIAGDWAAARWSLSGLLTARRTRRGIARATPLTVRAKAVRAVAAVLVFGSLAYAVDQYVITTQFQPTEAMSPTYAVGDRIVLDRALFRLTGLDRGDVVVVDVPHEARVLKRIVAFGGDKVSCEGGDLLVNGARLAEPYLERQHSTYCDAATVPNGEIYVVGDNREQSSDSRNLGTQKLDAVHMKAIGSF